MSRESDLKPPITIKLLFVSIVCPLIHVIIVHYFHGLWSESIVGLGVKLPWMTQLVLDCLRHLNVFYLVGSMGMVAIFLNVKSSRKRAWVFLLYLLAWQLTFEFVLWDLSIPFTFVNDHGIQLPSSHRP
jgi:hypothetical protein